MDCTNTTTNPNPKTAATNQAIGQKIEYIRNMILRQELFWEYDLKEMDTDTHASTVIPRVLERGTFTDWNEIRKYYGDEKIKTVLLQVRYLNNKSLHFVSNFYDIPLENFRCYTQKQLNLTHWNF